MEENLTYTEEQGRAPFDWREKLNDAKAGLPTDYQELFDRSSTWVTCAVGNQCAIIPRTPPWGEPDDARLAALGIEFHYAVLESDWSRALRILTLIEIRSAYLIKELTRKKS